MKHFEVLGASVEERAKEIGVGRSTLYEAIARGELRARKLSRRTVIINSDWREFLDKLPVLKPSKAEAV